MDVYTVFAGMPFKLQDLLPVGHDSYPTRSEEHFALDLPCATLAARQDVHQSGLARTTGTHQGCEAPGMKNTIEVLDDIQFLLRRKGAEKPEDVVAKISWFIDFLGDLS